MTFVVFASCVWIHGVPNIAKPHRRVVVFDVKNLDLSTWNPTSPPCSDRIQTSCRMIGFIGDRSDSEVTKATIHQLGLRSHDPRSGQLEGSQGWPGGRGQGHPCPQGRVVGSQRGGSHRGSDVLFVSEQGVLVFCFFHHDVLWKELERKHSVPGWENTHLLLLCLLLVAVVQFHDSRECMDLKTVIFVRPGWESIAGHVRFAHHRTACVNFARERRKEKKHTFLKLAQIQHDPTISRDIKKPWMFCSAPVWGMVKYCTVSLMLQTKSGTCRFCLPN